MTINEKIHMIRVSQGMSQAELAFKTGYTINDIILFEKNGTIITGYILLQIINAFNITVDSFMKINPSIHKWAPVM